MALPWNDGSIPVGFADATVTINSVSYIVESWSVDTPTNVVRRYNAEHAPSGSIGTVDFKSGTATLQLASAATALPTVGQTFVTTGVQIPAGTWYVTSVSTPQAAGDISKITIGFIQKVN